MQDDVGAALCAFDGLDFEVARAFAAPAHAFSRRGACTSGLHRQPVGDDEAAVEADAKLANEVGVFFLVALQLGHEFARAALGDGAQVLHGFGRTHADAVVADGEGLGLFV